MPATSDALGTASLSTRLIGEENDGWSVMRGLLAIEHEWVGRSGDAGAATPGGIEDLVALARSRGIDRDPTVRRQVAEAHVALTVQQLAGLPVGEFGVGAMKTSKPVTEVMA